MVGTQIGSEMSAESIARMEAAELEIGQALTAGTDGASTGEASSQDGLLQRNIVITDEDGVNYTPEQLGEETMAVINTMAQIQSKQKILEAEVRELQFRGQSLAALDFSCKQALKQLIQRYKESGVSVEAVSE